MDKSPRCPECDAYIGFTAKFCECGWSKSTRKKDDPVPKRNCPDCNEIKGENRKFCFKCDWTSDGAFKNPTRIATRAVLEGCSWKTGGRPCRVPSGYNGLCLWHRLISSAPEHNTVDAFEEWFKQMAANYSSGVFSIRTTPSAAWASVSGLVPEYGLEIGARQDQRVTP